MFNYDWSVSDNQLRFRGELKGTLTPDGVVSLYNRTFKERLKSLFSNPPLPPLPGFVEESVKGWTNALTEKAPPDDTLDDWPETASEYVFSGKDTLFTTFDWPIRDKTERSFDATEPLMKKAAKKKHKPKKAAKARKAAKKK